MNNTERIEKLENELKELKEMIENIKPRDRGPKSQRKMTLNDAERVILGDLKNESHMKCAEELGLSYGQIYSARGSYTFREVSEKKIEEDKKNKK